ncbi:MAG: hypothetical protein ACYTBJ_21865 [Planctomycetota bacterium]
MENWPPAVIIWVCWGQSVIIGVFWFTKILSLKMFTFCTNLLSLSYYLSCGFGILVILCDF